MYKNRLNEKLVTSTGSLKKLLKYTLLLNQVIVSLSETHKLIPKQKVRGEENTRVLPGYQWLLIPII